MKGKAFKSIAWLSLFLCLSFISLQALRGHCDTMNGPVVKAAKLALEKGDVTPVLKWVKSEYEAEARQAFEKTIKVRGMGSDARELADKFFFETIVRLHRLGEGAPYTGLKPADYPVEPAVKAADEALENGRVEGLVNMTSEHVAAALRARFDQALKAKKKAEQSVTEGRKYVEAYVNYVHFVEELHLMARGEIHHGEGETQVETEGPHKH